MRRTTLAMPLLAGCLLVFGAACGEQGHGDTTATGSGGLAPVSPQHTSPAAKKPEHPDSLKPRQPVTKTTQASTEEQTSPADCISYNPNTITFSKQGAIYTITDGSTVVMRLNGQSSDDVAQQGVALAQRYRKHCFLGRANTRTEDRGDYIFDYWRDPSGQTPTIPDEEDACSPYNNQNLTVDDTGDGNGWRVRDHDHVLHMFDNESDARTGEKILAKYSQACSIGYADDTNQDMGSVTYFK